MPVYQYKCTEHGVFERFLKASEHRSVSACPLCEAESRQIITSVSVHIPRSMRWDFDPYQSPASGNVISSDRQRQADFANTGTMEWEPGMRQDKERDAKEAEQELDKAIDETVEREIENMSGEDRAALTQFETQIERLTAEGQ